MLFAFYVIITNRVTLYNTHKGELTHVPSLALIAFSFFLLFGEATTKAIVAACTNSVTTPLQLV